jgi:hypothetical protein
MKSLKAIITTLILGSSTVALAQPAARDHRDFSAGYYGNASYYNGRDRDRDGIPDRREMRWHRMRPQTLASNLDLSRPQFLPLASRGVTLYNRIRLDGDLNGRTYIDSVMLRFDDGHTQIVSVKQMLSRRNPTIEIDTRGAVGVFIRGSQLRRGTFDVVGFRR